MADRFSAQIWIGGQLSRTARLYPGDPNDNTTILQGLIGALHDDGASHQYGDVVIPCDCKKDLGNYLSEDGAWLNLKHDQACNGEFDETERFCLEHGIPFNRWSDHYCEYDGENVYWRPGMKTLLITYASSGGNEIIEAAKVREALAKLDAIVNHAQERINLSKGIQLLREVCPELPPELEVFNITP